MAQQRMDSPIDAGPLALPDGEDKDQQCFVPLEAPFTTSQALGQDCTNADVLLLSWILVLSRYGDRSDVEFKWGYTKTNEDGTSETVEAFLSAADVPFNLDDSASVLLQTVKDVRKRTLPDESSVSGTPDTLFFTNSKDWNLKIEVICKGNDDESDASQTGQLGLQASWHTLFMTQYTAERHALSAIDILNAITTNPDTSISDLLRLTERDLSEIWRWNRTLPPTITKCMHELVAERAQAHPTALAIDAWDGRFTFAEVETQSTALAQHLTALGLGANMIAPLCFEKSRWTVVAVLAVMKTGAAFVLTDPSQPLARLQGIAAQVCATFVLTSAANAALGAAIAPAATVVPVSAATFAAALQPSAAALPPVPLDALMYVIFTSGSTGQPKGVMLSHGAYGSGTLPRAAAVGYDAASRVLDFASYAFDVSIDSMLATLAHGGCLCIPSDAERLDDLSGFIRRLRVTMANLTPSVARILDPDIVPGLRSLGVGGEAVTASDVAIWGRETRVVNGYGPSEVGVGCTTNHSAATGRPYVSIGPGTGGVMWIVDPEDHNVLLPVGAVGELLVEGPCVGEGYLGDPEKTAAAFIADPPWLVAGFGEVQGRRGRLYKTGDLVKYDPDGSGYLVFAGRKDTQVKLRGQRVELGEVEYHLRSQLPSRVRVAAEVIKPEGGKEPTLVAFIFDPEHEAAKDGSTDVQRVNFTAEVAAVMKEMDGRLGSVLPKYMVPAAYISISHMPHLVSGKTDRKILRAAGASMVLQDLAKLRESAGDAQEPTTPVEMSLRKIWSRIFNMPEEEIGINHSFFALGGDSVSAMKLVAAAREDGLGLSVSDIFTNPKLSAMAAVAQETEHVADTDVPAFSLIESGWDVEAARSEAASLCGVDPSMIEDIYPCTPLQEVLMAFTARSTKSFVAQRIADIPDESAALKLAAAWEAAASSSPILRTRVVQFQDHGLLQVVVKEPISWDTAADLDAYIAAEKSDPMGLGTPLSRYALIHDHTLDKRHFVWTVHHALYDGWSTPLILERVQRAHQHLATPRPSQMKHFVAHLRRQPRATSEAYWQRALAGATGPQYPSLPSRTYLPQPDALVERRIALSRRGASAVMAGTLIRGAWALVAAQQAGADDVVFGETFTGRGVAVPGAELIEGPMITTVPVRVRVDRAAPVREFLLGIQEQGFARLPHEHLGMQHIRRVSADAQLACEVKMGLVIQPGEIEEGEAAGGADGLPPFRATDAAREALHFNSYPLMLVCSLQADGFLVMASFDSNLVAVPQMERVLAQLERVVGQLALESDVPVGEISALTEQDQEQIWQWNRTPPAGIDQATPRLVAGHVAAGDPYPAVVVPWIVDPACHDRLMPIGAVGELVVEGPLASVDFVQDPVWLVNGSSSVPGRQGQVHRTGDLVRYSADGSITFVARKEAKNQLQGHAVDLQEVERHLETLLPESTWVAAHIVQAQEPMLVAFVEAPVADTNDNSNLVELDLGEEQLPAFISRIVPVQLAERLIGLNKALSDVLPPYMIPGAYVPIQEMPVSRGEIDRTQLDAISSEISDDLILRLRTAVTKLRASGVDRKPWTAKERKLQQLWSQFLGIDPSDIDRDDSFFRLGGDSIMAMRLVSAARQVGFKLSVADVFRRMRLSDMANALEETTTVPAQVQTFPAFSALGIEDADAFVSQEIQPALSDASWKIKDVLPVPDPQSRDLEATIGVTRSAVQYNMLYLPKSIDQSRLLECCQQLVSHHEILRTVFVQQRGSYFQVVLEELNAPVAEYQADQENIDAFVNNLCASDLDAGLSLGEPFLKFLFIHGQQSENCLAIRLSHAQYDGISLPELIRQVELLYAGGTLPSTPDFSTYIHHLVRADQSASHAHWRALLANSTPTILDPTLTPTQKAAPAIFIKKPVDIANRPADITLSTLLTAAWALVLAQRLSLHDVCFGGVGTGRGTDVPGADAVMGPTYRFVPIRVTLERGATTAAELLRSVQDQRAGAVRFEDVGFAGAARCAGWEGAAFFDSVVHHQDVDDFDAMPFAGGTARVEIANPCAEPAWPVKVVSFAGEGRFCNSFIRTSGEFYNDFTR
ncbi:Nonribosomal peptide synthase [Neofusicoccum parvum]|nr:Nonribosomal peptide synthase [Neofusicoccum parvum]